MMVPKRSVARTARGVSSAPDVPPAVDTDYLARHILGLHEIDDSLRDVLRPAETGKRSRASEVLGARLVESVRKQNDSRRDRIDADRWREGMCKSARHLDDGSLRH